MTDQATESPAERPLKRWRKTKWFYGVIVTYLVVPVALVIWWSGYSHRKFNEAIAPVIGRGEPLIWSDFATDPIPDDDNAAVLYAQAIEMPLVRSMTFSGHQFKFDDIDDIEDPRGQKLMVELGDSVGKPALLRERLKEVRELLGMASGILELCRAARSCDKVCWKIDFNRSPLEYDDGLIPSGYVRIAKLLYLAAIEAHESGRHDEALEYLRDGVAMSDVRLRNTRAALLAGLSDSRSRQSSPSRSAN